MNVITFSGIVENGQIRLPPNVRLPERATVYVVVPDSDLTAPSRIASPHLCHPEQAVDFRKEVTEVPADGSV
jgi:hypothetical protein